MANQILTSEKYKKLFSKKSHYSIFQIKINSCSNFCYIFRKDFFLLFGKEEQGNEIAEEIWKFLEQNEIIVHGKVKSRVNINEAWKDFPYKNSAFEEGVKAILRSSRDLSKGVGKAAAHGAVMGTAMGAMTAIIKQNQLIKTVFTTLPHFFIHDA